MASPRLLISLSLFAVLFPVGRLWADRVEPPDPDSGAALEAEPPQRPKMPPKFPVRPAGVLDASKEGIALEIKGLASEDPDVRLNAAGRLFWIGEPARAALTEALTSKDVEVASASARIIDFLNSRKELSPIDSNQRVSARFMVSCDKEDPDAPGGFYHANNPPSAIPAGLKAPEKSVSLVIGDDTVAAWEGMHLGLEIHIVNTSTEEAAFNAADSALSLVIEAKDASGAWKTVTDLPGSDCGNSYHRVFLAPGEMWTVVAPVLTGPVKTKLRYRLLMAQGDKDQPIYSAEFDGAIHAEQLAVEK